MQAKKCEVMSGGDECGNVAMFEVYSDDGVYSVCRDCLSEYALNVYSDGGKIERVVILDVMPYVQDLCIPPSMLEYTGIGVTVKRFDTVSVRIVDNGIRIGGYIEINGGRYEYIKDDVAARIKDIFDGLWRETYPVEIGEVADARAFDIEVDGGTFVDFIVYYGWWRD